ncbi:hypothetical protein UK23_20645 [Lentzea aerocolonigenes]|uniref:Tissue inhibitor of metalloproteinase n=1 Tax=Lentzea aerocolonigenes TaxID=68170 RepID=A0A0F0H118_LENAE|nr:hypothetical protein [Lentzea aerocolonigenes]KJK47353.1 hypothetical protein UK23_20645 [Lentzea aerocolonigenes]
MKRIVRMAAAVVLTAGMTTVAAGTAHACSCAPATEEQLLARADHVFQGRVLEKVVEAPQKVRYRVAVAEERKGDVPDEVGVVTYDNGGMCGVDLAVGKDYLIYATGDSSDGKVDTNLCSGTRQENAAPPSCRH